MRLSVPVALLLAVSAAVAADQKDAARPVLPRKGIPKGMPKAPKMGPPLSNPGSQVARLYRASPEERERALEKLPPRMQDQFRQQLARFDAMPKAQQDVLIQRAERFAALSTEEKAAVERLMQSLRQLPEDRRRELGLAIRRMQPLSAEERQKLIDSDEFKGRFSADEQKIVVGLSQVMTP